MTIEKPSRPMNTHYTRKYKTHKPSMSTYIYIINNGYIITKITIMIHTTKTGL